MVKVYHTQPCIPLGSLYCVPALTGWGKGGNVTSAGWQVTLCDPIWHVSSRSGEACGELLYPVTYLLTHIHHEECWWGHLPYLGLEPIGG